MKLCDLHCDTAMWLYQKNESLAENSLHISKKLFENYDKYIQLTAVFTSPRLSDDEGYRRFWEVREKLISECDKCGIPLVGTSAELEQAIASVGRAFILTVEDARIIGGDISRLRELYDAGVRVITPLWGGNTVIGGSHDTENGLTDFGRDAVSEMIRLGIIPDISHASGKAADDILDLCEEASATPIATHMNSHSVCRHSRNLTDERFLRLCRLGGIAGISLYPKHLTGGERCTAHNVALHAKKYAELCPAHVSLGCDLDGVECLPDGITDISCLLTLAEPLAGVGLTGNEISALFYDTAKEFLINNLPKE